MKKQRRPQPVASLKQTAVYLTPEDTERLRRVAFELRASSRSAAMRMLLERAARELGLQP